MRHTNDPRTAALVSRLFTGHAGLSLVTSALVLFWTFNCCADMGPKPTMDFQFRQLVPGAPLTILSGVLLESSRSDCTDAAPLERLGPQGFDCKPASCHALAYGFKQYHRLELTFSDGKTRRSNVFETAEFRSDYQVAIDADHLQVQPVFHFRGARRAVWRLPGLVLCAIVAACAASCVLPRKRPC